MIKAVIFDMYETLITHYESQRYFSDEMAYDAGITVNQFRKLWHYTEDDRTIGKITFEQIIKMILEKNDCYSKEKLDLIVKKRIEAKEECFKHLHREIIPMLQELKKREIKVGLISNCFSEEASVINNSVLYKYFDSACLSYEHGLQKPNEEIFIRCMEELGVLANECLYVGDGGSNELEAAGKLGMKPLQAVWYFKEGMPESFRRKDGFEQIDYPLRILEEL